MGKPTIGTAITPEIRDEQRKEIKELTVLKEEDKRSIYNMIFLETEEGGMKDNE